MKKLKIVLLGIMILGLFLLTRYNKSYSNKERFVKISDEGSFIVCYDSKTKVQYIISDGYYNSGTATMLVDAEGKPLLYKED